MKDSKEFQNFKRIHEEEMKKAQYMMSKANDKMRIALGEIVAQQFIENRAGGSIRIDYKRNGPEFEIECSRTKIIMSAYQLLRTAYGEHMEYALSELMGIMVQMRVLERLDVIDIKECKVEKANASQEEIDVLKAMMSMSPEELEKLKEQMNE